MRKHLLFLLSLLLISCGPRFRTDYQLTPPKSSSGRQCIFSCQSRLQECEAKDEYAYQNCLNRAESTYQVCEAGKQMGPDPVLGWMTPLCIKNCYCSRDYCSRPSGEHCKQRYHECYQNCGGTVTANTVCVANCDKIKSPHGGSESIVRAASEAKEAIAALCEDSDYEDFFVKSTCDEEKITLAQLADSSKLDNQLIPVVSNFRAREKEIEVKFSSAVEQNGRTTSVKVSKLIQETSKKADSLFLRLVEQKIRLGEFNKARQEMRNKFASDLKKILK